MVDGTTGPERPASAFTDQREQTPSLLALRTSKQR